MKVRIKLKGPGLKGRVEFDQGVIYAPYIPMTVTDRIILRPLCWVKGSSNRKMSKRAKRCFKVHKQKTHFEAVHARRMITKQTEEYIEKAAKSFIGEY